MSDFALSNDQAMLLQGRGKSKINYPAAFSANSRPIHGGGRVDEPLQARNFDPCAQTARKKDVTASMSADAKLFPADGYAGIGGVSSTICSPEGGDGDAVRAQDDQHKNHGSDLLLFDWPELDGLEDFGTDLRKLDSAFEIGSNYFDDPLWPSICSPDVQLVPSSHSVSDDPRSSYAANESATEINPTLKSTVSVSDADTIDQRPPALRSGHSETPLNCSSSSSVETEHFPRLSDADLLCPFDDMLVPTSSSIMCNDEILPRSGGPDGLVSAYVPRGSSSTKRPPHAAPTPDMMLEEMAGNPLEMYFPPLTTYEQEQPQLPMTGAASTRMHHQLLPEGFAGEGALEGAGSQLGSKGRRSPGEIHPTAPVKQHFGFQKLQEGMNQLDVGTKTCIRDALYRLANSVEQRHCVVDQSVGSSIGNRQRTTSSVWSETESSPMDRSVAQLLLQKPPCRKTTAADRRANRAA